MYGLFTYMKSKKMPDMKKGEMAAGKYSRHIRRILAIFRGGFKHFLFLPLPGEMIQFEMRIFLKRLGKEPPTNKIALSPIKMVPPKLPKLEMYLDQKPRDNNKLCNYCGCNPAPPGMVETL